MLCFENFEKNLNFRCVVRTLDGTLKLNLDFIWRFYIINKKNMQKESEKKHFHAILERF